MSAMKRTLEWLALLDEHPPAPSPRHAEAGVAFSASTSRPITQRELEEPGDATGIEQHGVWKPHGGTSITQRELLEPRGGSSIIEREL